MHTNFTLIQQSYYYDNVPTIEMQRITGICLKKNYNLSASSAHGANEA
jgi:hypothetical protein